jgi:hypothetical protein
MGRGTITVRVSDAGKTWLRTIGAQTGEKLGLIVTPSDVLRAALAVAARHEQEVIDIITMQREQP